MTDRSDQGNVPQQIRCPQCSGAMTFDAGTQQLCCGFCKHTMLPSAHPDAGTVGTVTAQPEEIPLSEGLRRAHRGFGTVLSAIECRECGAVINLGPNDHTAVCMYCASHAVMPKATDPDVITPESLVPFKLEQKAATETFHRWIRRLWFRPNDLSRMARLEKIIGVYVPFWTFDAWVTSDWTAQRGWHYYETEYYTEEVNGRMERRERRVQKTRYEPASGARRDFHNDVLVCGSGSLPRALVQKFSTFDTAQLVPYAPGFLAGWRAETYSVGLDSAWSQGREVIEGIQTGRCANDVGGDTHRFLTVDSSFSRETFKHVLLPVYVAAYRYKEKPFRVLVNGQTAEIVGEAPWSFWKIFLFVLFIVTLVVGIAVLVRSQQETPPPPQSSTGISAPALAP